MYTSDFLIGLAHPLTGADHVLAMVAVGLWSAMAGGRAVWVWPLAFVLMVLMGFAAGFDGLHVPLVEPTIISSVVVLGLLVALAVPAPLWGGVVIMGLFAFVHGHAHGTEILGRSLQPIAYALGFSLATAALHVTGLWCGLLLARWPGKSLRAMGGLIALGGVALIAMAA